MTTIAEKVHELTTVGRASQLPDAVKTVFAADQARLDAEGIPAGVLTAGASMPDGALLDIKGLPTTLDQVRAGARAVVVFYRGAWCPFCNIALRTYQEDLVPELAARGITLIAISPQKPDGSLTMQESNELTFTVLSDPRNQITHQLGDVIEAQGNIGVDLATVNADGAYGLAMPTVVIVEADGTIGWIDVHPNFTTRTEVPEILAALG
jgi:peroxiredoxin